MKTIRKHLKLISLFLSITFFIQSCSVYRTNSVTIDDAIASNNKVKLISTQDTYEFQDLQRENGNIYGIAKKNSITAKSLSSQITDDTKNSKFVKILLTNEQLENIHLENKTMSTLSIIAIPIVVVGIIAIIAAKSMDFGSFGLGE